MNSIQGSDHMVDDAPPFSTVWVYFERPSSVLVTAFLHFLAWGTNMIRDRNLDRRIDHLEQYTRESEPRIANLEKYTRDIEPRMVNLEAEDFPRADGYCEEYLIKWDTKSRIRRARRYCSAEETQKEVKVTPKSFTTTIASSRPPTLRRSNRLQQQQEAGE